MTFKKENYTTTLVRAKQIVPGFKGAFSRFEERLVLDQLSEAISRIQLKNIQIMSNVPKVCPIGSKTQKMSNKNAKMKI